jgi:hypothetical protein
VQQLAAHGVLRRLPLLDRGGEIGTVEVDWCARSQMS